VKRFCGVAVVAALAGLAWLAPSAGAWSQFCCMPWDAPMQMVFSADGRFAYADSYNITLVLARDPDTGALTTIDSYDVGGGPIALSPDGSTLYVSDTTQSYSARITALARDPDTGLLTRVGTWAGDDYARYADFEVSRDGRQLYAADTRRDAVVILDRDPASGSLSYRGEVRSGDPGVEDLKWPAGLALSADDRYLYVGVTATSGVVTLRRAADGSLSFASSNPDCRCGYGDLALAPGGGRLFGGPTNVSAIDRDPDTGQLGDDATFAPASNGGDLPQVADDHVLPTPDGTGIWVADQYGDRLLQYGYGPSGFTTVRAYREGVDGTGLRDPRGVVLSPDGRNVYVPSYEDSTSTGRIAVFKRDESTNQLSFVSLLQGPAFDGRPPGSKPPAVQINGGDQFTDDPDVELTVSNIDGAAGAFGFDVSNDGGFGTGTQHFDIVEDGERYPWTLATSGPERLAKTVYVRGFGMSGANVLTDDIVLDQRPPAVDAARVVAAHVRVRAHDRISGLGRMQVTRHRASVRHWQRFKRSARVPRGHGTVWVRVRDRAGNRSRWRRAADRKHR
jgi:6-phosphogluconolactonase (cycloisomerase 2 family)